MVEDHSGESDISQSMAQKVIRMTWSTTPPAAIFFMRGAMEESPVWSCLSDRRERISAKSVHNAKHTSARTMKPVGVRYAARIPACGSSCPSWCPVHT